jgi:asparagine synthase (glutamine-hydrolysing)
MSAFAVVFDRSNTPVEPRILERVMERLSHRGPDGSDSYLDGNIAMGHWHFWTNPEEVGERQPLAQTGQPYRIVMDGRLDNRQEILHDLNLNYVEESHLSDAALVLFAYDKWGKDCFRHFIGEFALAILDEKRGELVCARDPLGDRSLFYAFKGNRLVVASESWAVAGADGSVEELNENAVAHFFALEANQGGETLYKNVLELLPAHGMVISSIGISSWCYWRPDPSVKMRGKPDQEYAEGFRILLEESVRCRLRSNYPAAVMMSGGLDSTSVACLAARLIAPEKLTTVSYVFDELTDCDERGYIEAVKARWGINSIQVLCDDLWPYRNLQDFPHNPNGPDGNCYRMILERTYQHAAQAGLHVLLTGHCGDDLYDGDDEWLADLITEGRLREAGREFRLHLRSAGAQQTMNSAYLRLACLRILQSLPAGRRVLDPIVKRWRIHKHRTATEWLAPFSTARLSQDKYQLDPAFAMKQNLLGALTADGIVSEIHQASRFGLELRYPYRDRRLVEYVLALPAHQLYFHGQYKYILRTAMQGALPEVIRTRRIPTTLLSLFSRGLERDKITLTSHINNFEEAWRKYVRADWLKDHWNIPVTPESDGAHAVVPWLCVSFSLWYKAFASNGVEYAHSS